MGMAWDTGTASTADYSSNTIWLGGCTSTPYTVPPKRLVHCSFEEALLVFRQDKKDVLSRIHADTVGPRRRLPPMSTYIRGEYSYPLRPRRR